MPRPRFSERKLEAMKPADIRKAFADDPYPQARYDAALAWYQAWDDWREQVEKPDEPKYLEDCDEQAALAYQDSVRKIKGEPPQEDPLDMARREHGKEVVRRGGRWLGFATYLTRKEVWAAIERAKNPPPPAAKPPRLAPIEPRIEAPKRTVARGKWTNDWVASLPHPLSGEPEAVFKDPVLAGHRLTVTRLRKKFEVQARQPKTRKSFVVIVGDATTGTTVEQARAKAVDVLSKIRGGDDPRSKSKATVTTLQMAMDDYAARSDLRPSTLLVYANTFATHLAHWKDVPLRTLLDNPRMAFELHKRITKESGPSAGDHAMRLLRALYMHASQLDTSLPRDRHPASAVQWHGGKTRTKASIPAADMPKWKKQLEALRVKSPQRAAFQLLLLRLGCRPGELASATWPQVDLKNKIFRIPTSKTLPYKQPIPKQAIAEFKALAELREGDYVFPARGKSGYLTRLQEEALSHSSNQMRHTHHTIGTLLGVAEMTLDVLEGRSLLKADKGAGRGYVDSTAFDPETLEAQDAINARIDVLFKSGRT